MTVPTLDKTIKSFPAFIQDTKEEGDLGIVAAFVSIMGNIDHHMEVIVNGAFTKTIAERWQKIRVLDNHNFRSAEDAIAKLLVIREVGRNELPAELLAAYPDATGGLYIECQFMLDEPTDKSATIFRRIKKGLIDEYSIGFQIIKADWREVNTNEGKMKIRFITEIKLFEFSPVIFAANDATATVGAKLLDIHINEDSSEQPFQINFNIPENLSDAQKQEAAQRIIKELEALGVPLSLETASDEESITDKDIEGYQLAEADARCQNCKFYKAVTDSGKSGYCKQHDSRVSGKYVCDSYEVMKVIETIGSTFKVSLNGYFEKQIQSYSVMGIMDEDDQKRLAELVPTVIDTIFNLLPSDILGRELPNEEYQLPKSDDPEAEPDKAPLTSVDEDELKQFQIESQRRIAELRQKRLTIQNGGAKNA